MKPAEYQKLRDAAKSVSIETVLHALGFQAAKQSQNGELWYRSPFRDENTPSFHVLTKTNQWHDFGQGMERPADSITLAMKLTGKPFTEACEWLVGLSGVTIAKNTVKATPRPSVWQDGASKKPVNDNPVDTGHILEDVYEFSVWAGRGRNREFSPQARYLSNRGLDPNRCAPYLATIKFSPAHKKTAKWYAIGFPNNGGGYEVRAQFGQTHFKSCVGPRDITTLFAKVPKGEIPPARLHVFEGFPDFLTFLHLKPELDPKRENFLILNGTGMTARALSVIEAGIGENKQKFEPLILWTQNDTAGEEIAEQLYQQGIDLGVTVGSMQHLYSDHKDLSEFWQESRNNGQSIMANMTPQYRPAVDISASGQFFNAKPR